jgi:hypothetical protein
MIIECPKCESHVDSKVLGKYEGVDGDDSPWKLTLVQCVRCGGPLLASQELVQVDAGEWNWDSADTVWPQEKRPHWDLPEAVQDSLLEAQKCCKAKAFSACAVMVGRALEAVCVEHTSEKTLHRGLRALKDKGLIDGRLFDWSESLRDERNLGAHATGHRTSAQDARDLMEFAMAICEYIYILSRKYAAYQTRKANRPKASSKATPPTQPIAANAPPIGNVVPPNTEAESAKETPPKEPRATNAG